MVDLFPEHSESDLSMKINLVIEWQNNYWIRLSQNFVICHCLSDQLLIFLTTDKWRYFAQPRPVIIKHLDTGKNGFLQINSSVFCFQAAFKQTAQIRLYGNSSEAIVSDKE